MMKFEINFILQWQVAEMNEYALNKWVIKIHKYEI